MDLDLIHIYTQVYQAGNAVTLPASVSRGQPAAPSMPAAPGMPPAEVDAADRYKFKKA